MKHALILHGTDDDSTKNWFPWLKTQLESRGYTVWVPDLPQSSQPNIDRYNQHIFNNRDFKFDSSTLIVGHSSGAVAILGLLAALPDNTGVDLCVLVGSFKNDLNWDALKELFLKPFNFELIKSKSRKFLFVHSDNDPYCPLEHAKYLSSQVNGELVIIPGEKHFSIGTAGEKYRHFPELLKLIQDRLSK